MNTLAFPILAAIAASSALTSSALAGDPASLCRRLAGDARALPAAAWSTGVEAALQGALQIQPDRPDDDAFATSLVKLPWVARAVGAGDQLSAFVSQLPGTDLYMVSTYGGTLHCQSSVFLKARAGRAAKEAKAPETIGEGDLCWTRSGSFARLYGQAGFVEHGTLNDHTYDSAFKFIPWTGAGWGAPCDLTLRFRSGFAIKDRHCADDAVCRGLDGVGLSLARGYAAWRERDARRDTASLRFGPAAPAGVEATVQRLYNDQGSADRTPDFPRFADKARSPYGGSFSYTGFQYLPLQLAGHWYVAGIGHEGVGWRESNRTLIAVYEPQADGALEPKASIEIETANGGLIAAEVGR